MVLSVTQTFTSVARLPTVEQASFLGMVFVCRLTWLPRLEDLNAAVCVVYDLRLISNLALRSLPHCSLTPVSLPYIGKAKLCLPTAFLNITSPHPGSRFHPPCKSPAANELSSGHAPFPAYLSVQDCFFLTFINRRWLAGFGTDHSVFQVVQYL